jgi:membrane protease YdiL (CAAX protease family)
MKQCPYCGKEYSDEVTLCPIDRQPLNEVGAAKQGDNPKNPPSRSDVHVVYPEYQWSARDAWKFFGMIIVFYLVLGFVGGSLYFLFPPLRVWSRSPFGVIAMRVIEAGLWILTAAYFARTESVASFCKAVSLDRKPSNYVWFGIVAALAIRLVSHFVFVLQLAKGSYTNYDLWAFKETSGPGRYLYLLPLLTAPFWEEAVVRGFFYKAFRGSYSIPAATTLIVAWTALTHWDQYRSSSWAAIALSALTILQCYLREKSDSLWDCICCHFAFNASLLFYSGALR